MRPRYRSPVQFSGIEFRDDAFGEQFLRRDKEVKLKDETLVKIHSELLKEYKNYDLED